MTCMPTPGNTTVSNDEVVRYMDERNFPGVFKDVSSSTSMKTESAEEAACIVLLERLRRTTELRNMQSAAVTQWMASQHMACIVGMSSMAAGCQNEAEVIHVWDLITGAFLSMHHAASGAAPFNSTGQLTWIHDKAVLALNEEEKQPPSITCIEVKTDRVMLHHQAALEAIISTGTIDWNGDTSVPARIWKQVSSLPH